MAIDEQIVVREAVFHAALRALAHIVIFKDFRQDLEALFRDERVSERAVAFTSTFGAQANVLGNAPSTHLSSWISEDANTYPLRREEPWEPVDDKAEDKPEGGLGPPGIVQGVERPPELLDPNQRSHDQITTVSIIRERLWDRAGWTGTVFLTDRSNEYPPVFGLVFSNRQAGQEIFEHWRKDIGEVDKQGQVRLSVIRGIDKKHPDAYRVIVGSDPNSFSLDTRFVTFVNRVHRMDPIVPGNLERFLNAYSKVGALYLAPAFAPPDYDGTQLPEVKMDLNICVRRVHMRDAWEIGLHDIDSVAIHDDDDPVIPEGVENPPVLDLLRHRAG